MPKIDFEGVADSGSITQLPANYAGFKWKHALAADKATEVEGVTNIVQGNATGLLGFDNFNAVMKSESGDFTLVDGTFAAAYSFASPVTLKVKGYDNAVQVAKQKFEFDSVGAFESFKAAFASIDKVKFHFTNDVAVEDLQVQFESAARGADDWAFG